MHRQRARLALDGGVVVLRLAKFRLQLRDFLRLQAEAARRAGLYPGTVREMRRKYRLGWDGWEG